MRYGSGLTVNTSVCFRLEQSQAPLFRPLNFLAVLIQGTQYHPMASFNPRSNPSPCWCSARNQTNCEVPAGGREHRLRNKASFSIGTDLESASQLVKFVAEHLKTQRWILNQSTAVCDVMSDAKKQHYVPQFYLRQFVDPNTPAGQEPYVWILSKNGKTKSRRAPKNILWETDLYTFFDTTGTKHQELERTLSQIESDFAGTVQRKIKSHLPLSDQEHATDLVPEN